MFEACEDVICGLGPYERLGIAVVHVEVLADGLLELPGRSMRAAADVVLRQRGEPALDLVEPGRRGGGEVDVESRVAREPGLDRGRLVDAAGRPERPAPSERGRACRADAGRSQVLLRILDAANRPKDPANAARPSKCTTLPLLSSDARNQIRRVTRGSHLASLEEDERQLMDSTYRRAWRQPFPLPIGRLDLEWIQEHALAAVGRTTYLSDPVGARERRDGGCWQSSERAEPLDLRGLRAALMARMRPATAVTESNVLRGVFAGRLPSRSHSLANTACPWPARSAPSG